MKSERFAIACAFTAVPALFSGNLMAAALEEVIVTAQKRSESVQDVPVAVTAMSQDAMREAGVFSAKDLTDVNPSVSFDIAQSSQNASLKIRGIGTVGNGRTFEGAVGVFIDGVYRSRSGMAMQDMNDISRLEILRGPQGTLFGKNTVAGALSMSSTRPNFDGVNGSIEIGGGSYDHEMFSAAVNVPVGEKHALRFSGISNRRDGYYESPQQQRTYNDVDRFGVKGQWLFDINDSLSSLLVADYTKSDAECCFGSAQVVSGPLQPGIELFANHRGLETYTEEDNATERRLTNVNGHSIQISEDYGLSWTLELALEAVDVKSITGLRRYKDEQIDSDADFGPAHVLLFDEPAVLDFFSQEFNFSWAWAETDFVAGLYYSFETIEHTRSVVSDTDANSYVSYLVASQANPDAALESCRLSLQATGSCGDFQLVGPGGTPVSIERYFQDSESYAAFLHSQTSLGERWTIIAGARYSYDSKEGGYENLFWYNSPVAQAIVASGAVGTPPSGDATTPRNAFDLAGTWRGESFDESFSKGVLTGTLAATFHITDDVNTYFSVGRGYKSGAVNLFYEADNLNNTFYEPEYATSYELGFKSRYLDGSAQTNIAVFHTEYTDLQLNFFTGLNFFTENAGEAVSKGVEVENMYQINESFRAELNMTFLDASFGDLSDGPEFTQFLTDRDTPRAPDFAGVAVLNYNKALSSSMEITSRLSASYNGEFYSGVNAEDQVQDAYTLIDFSLGMTFIRDQDWEVKLSCKNCTDETYQTFYFATPLQAGSFNTYTNEPRRLLLSFATRF
ncbi:TonB-dependent receptor [Spongiibacter sp. KMU-166]|uniref:TonB-dependent receptor n=1 Tax=Spongiibacter thalassae TaxID=2721624 RepID=A0ABX1GK38_9GAMM|nr:TonB-dependent receptor [Spongiibacter thalassae]NKI18717.1 TonB-dependent receptor [Spongiibacter thalassae]